MVWAIDSTESWNFPIFACRKITLILVLCMSSILQMTLMEVYTPGDTECWNLQALSLLQGNEPWRRPPYLGQTKTQKPCEGFFFFTKPHFRGKWKTFSRKIFFSGKRKISLLILHVAIFSLNIGSLPLLQFGLWNYYNVTHSL